MKAICFRSGSFGEPEEGTILELTEIYVSSAYRPSTKEVINIDSKSRPNHLLEQHEIRELLKSGDLVTDNYCNGDYKIL